MSLGCSMVMRVEQRQTMRLEQRLTLEHRLVHDKVITPIVVCPRCEKRFDPDREGGWSNDPYDYHITCIGCGHRFRGALQVEPRATSVVNERTDRLPIPRTDVFGYLCSVQTLQALRDIRDGRQPRRFPGLAWLHANRPDVLYSAVSHFGSVDEARKRLN